MKRVFGIGVIDKLVVVKKVDEAAQIATWDGGHFVLAFVDSDSAPVLVTVGHGVADAETAHEFANTGFAVGSIFGEQEMKVVGEKEESVEGTRENTLAGGCPLFGGEIFGGKAGNPRERGPVREAEIVGEG